MTRHHAMLFPSGPAIADIEALRHAWDPDMAGAIGPHITLVYPDEHPGLAALRERVAAVAKHERTFRLRLGSFREFAPPDDGCIYIEVQDLDGRFTRLREVLTAPPFRPITFPPHLTIIHPRTSKRGHEFWRAGVRPVPESDLVVEAIALTSFDAGGYAIDARIPLGMASDSAG
jgi:2'-5' RNA ligase